MGDPMAITYRSSLNHLMPLVFKKEFLCCCHSTKCPVVPLSDKSG